MFAPKNDINLLHKSLYCKNNDINEMLEVYNDAFSEKYANKKLNLAVCSLLKIQLLKIK